MISSEVNTFSHQVKHEDEVGGGDGGTGGGMTTSSFVFSVPTSLRERDSKALVVPRRSRSIPVGLDDSDEEDIEVPRFTSLDYSYDEFECDSDGDLDLPRRSESLAERKLLLEHKMTTELAEVGLQVWRGSLLLSDYLLHNHQNICDKTILEVGSGTGLASIVASFCGARVIATDIKNCDIIHLIKKNCTNNKDLIKGDISVKPLDFGDNLETEEYLEEIDTVIAGDIIYSDDITEKFLNFLKNLRQKSTRSLTVFVAMEKRFVFTLADLDTVAPAFDFFMEKLALMSAENQRTEYQEIELDFPQYFCYERSNEMIMIKIVLRSS